MGWSLRAGLTPWSHSLKSLPASGTPETKWPHWPCAGLFQLWLAWFPCDYYTFAPDPEGAQCLGTADSRECTFQTKPWEGWPVKSSEPLLGMKTSERSWEPEC